MTKSSGKAVQIGLGTVQFGIDYGIANSTRVSKDEVGKILNFASDSGINLLDTASSYGCSEEVIGNNLNSKLNFNFITKTPLDLQDLNPALHSQYIKKSLLKSLSLLKQSQVYCLLVHRPNDLLSNNGNKIFDELVSLKEIGLVKKIGVSVYQKEEIDAILKRFPIEVVQYPISVIDQRGVDSGCLLYLKDRGIEIHGRSIFLQGLILMIPKDIPKYFDPIVPIIKKFQNTAKNLGLTPLELAIYYVKGVKELDNIIVGAKSLNELKEIIDAFNKNLDLKIDFSSFAVSDQNFVNPKLWPSL